MFPTFGVLARFVNCMLRVFVDDTDTKIKYNINIDLFVYMNL